ncbi:hypothetical protein ACB092_06G027700 [Castanea dentata]
MELHALSLPTLFTFLLFTFMAVKLWKRSKTNHSNLNLTPGPWKLPIIGNVLQFRHGPLMHIELGEVYIIVDSSPELAEEVMKTYDLIFASRPRVTTANIITYDSTDIAFAPYGNYWRQQRKICMLELLEEELSTLIRWIGSKEGSTINLTEKLFSTIYGITSRAAFGMKFNDQEKFISVMKETSELLTAGLNIADSFPSAKLLHLVTGVRTKIERLHEESDRIMENTINGHKEINATRKADDDARVEDLIAFSLTNNNIKAVILDMSARSDTTSITLDWAKMMKNQIIKDTLRLHPAIPLLIPRECGERCRLNGYEIPVKTKVIVNAWAIGRDLKRWTEAEKFQPERFLDSSIDYNETNFEYIPFGAGRRICPGITFGMVNIKLPLALFLYHFDWKLPTRIENEDLDMNEAFGTGVRRKNDLQLIPIIYHPLPFD